MPKPNPIAKAMKSLPVFGQKVIPDAKKKESKRAARRKVVASRDKDG